MAVSTYDVSQRMTTVQCFVHEKLKLWEQIVNLQGLKDRYPHLRNLPSNGHNLNEVLVILGQDCSQIHHPLEFKNSGSNTVTLSMKSKIRLALSCPLPAKQAATLANTATWIADKLASQSSKLRDIESYASHCDVTGHSNEQQRAIKTLQQTTRFTCGRWKILSWTCGWLEIEVKLPNNLLTK